MNRARLYVYKQHNCLIIFLNTKKTIVDRYVDNILKTDDF